MMRVNSVQQIPWPEWSVYRPNEDIGEALYNATSLAYSLGHEEHNADLATLAITNGLIGDEPQRVLHNAAVSAISRLGQPSIAKLGPHHIEPLILAAAKATNAIAAENPLRIIGDKSASGLRQMSTVGETRSQLYQARHQNTAPIQEAPSEILTSGLDKQVFQPFAFVFVGKGNKEDPFDRLLRFKNPFATTVMGAVSEVLQGLLTDGLPKETGSKRKKTFREWWDEVI